MVASRDLIFLWGMVSMGVSPLVFVHIAISANMLCTTSIDAEGRNIYSKKSTISRTWSKPDERKTFYYQPRRIR